MLMDDADTLVAFPDVRVLRSTAPALLCRIGEKGVWLPRGHISGKLWCARALRHRLATCNSPLQELHQAGGRSSGRPTLAAASARW